jgi:hypothetical protein
MPDGSNLKGGAKRAPGRPRKLRTPENARRICDLTEQGYSLRQIAREIACTRPAIQLWISEDERKNGGAAIASRYARAKEAGLELLAEQVIEIADDRSFIGHPDASAIVQQQRLAVDTRKWFLSKMLPRKFGDRIEISGDPDAPVVSRIELVAVHPRPQVEPPTIDALPSDGRKDPQKR